MRPQVEAPIRDLGPDIAMAMGAVVEVLISQFNNPVTHL
jgi:hypothetical protein